MKMMVLPALAVGLLMATATVTPSSAAPASSARLAVPESAVDTVSYRKKKMKKRMYRRGDPRYAPRNAGNSRNPERPVYQQGQGNTSGGPAR